MLHLLTDLAGSGYVDGGAVGSCSHVVAVLHHLHFDVLRLQVVDEVRNIRTCRHIDKRDGNTSTPLCQLVSSHPAGLT